MRIDSAGMARGKIGDTLYAVPVMPELIVERLVEEAVIPTYASEGDSGMDLYAIEDMLIYPQDTELVRTGLRFQIPRHPLHDIGYRWEMQVRPRSGVSLNTKLVVANAPGTVDNFYTDEVKVIMRNTSEVPLKLKMKDGGMLMFNAPYVFDLKGKMVPWEKLPAELMDDTAGDDGFPLGTYLIRRGDRMAQIVFVEVIRPLKITEGAVNGSNSRGGGFGSTGI